MMPPKDNRKYPTIPLLVGSKVYLRPTSPEDARLTYQWFLHSDPQSQTCRQVVLTTPDEYADRAGRREKNPTRAEFMVLTTEDEIPVGKVAYFDLNLINRSAEIGFIIDPEQQKNGYGFEAVRLMIGYLFKQLDLNKVYAQTGEFNQASVALLTSLDFRLDGKLRQHHFYNGTFHDDFVYSLMKFEFGY